MSGARPLIEFAERLSGELARPQEHLRRVVYPLRRRFFADAFATSGASTSRPWPALEPQYQAMQRAIGDDVRPLRANRPRLEPSFQGGADHILRVGRSSIEVGSSVPWARHVAVGGVNPLTGETFPGRDPRPLTRAQIDEMTAALQRSITREAAA